MALQAPHGYTAPLPLVAWFASPGVVLVHGKLAFCVNSLKFMWHCQLSLLRTYVPLLFGVVESHTRVGECWGGSNYVLLLLHTDCRVYCVAFGTQVQQEVASEVSAFPPTEQTHQNWTYRDRSSLEVDFSAHC